MGKLPNYNIFANEIDLRERKMKRIFTLLLLLTLCALFIHAQSPHKIETGKATYYATKFNNRRTASGAIYKKDHLVCAHKTYPFGTKLRVKNLKNNKEVIVEVIDRGPFKKGLIIDLSLKAAKELDMVNHGVVAVEVSEYLEANKETTRVVATGNKKQN